MDAGGLGEAGTWVFRGWKVKSPELGRTGFGAVMVGAGGGAIEVTGGIVCGDCAGPAAGPETGDTRGSGTGGRAVPGATD